LIVRFDCLLVYFVDFYAPVYIIDIVCLFCFDDILQLIFHKALKHGIIAISFEKEPLFPS